MGPFCVDGVSCLFSPVNFRSKGTKVYKTDFDKSFISFDEHQWEHHSHFSGRKNRENGHLESIISSTHSYFKICRTKVM